MPNCVIVETMAEMEKPEDIKTAVKISFAFYVVCYLATGIGGCLAWGGDVAIPMTNVMQADFWGMTANFILVYCTMLDYVIGAVTVNRAVQRVWDPTYDYAWNVKGTLQWVYMSLPSTCLATAMALFIPRLESLTGLLNSVTGSTLQLTGVTTLIVISGVSAGKCNGHILAVGATIVWGLILTICILASAVYFMSNEDYGAGDFWCDVVG